MGLVCLLGQLGFVLCLCTLRIGRRHWSNALMCGQCAEFALMCASQSRPAKGRLREQEVVWLSDKSDPRGYPTAEGNIPAAARRI